MVNEWRIKLEVDFELDVKMALQRGRKRNGSSEMQLHGKLEGLTFPGVDTSTIRKTADFGHDLVI